MKLGLASTKCGSSVGLARVETSTLSPPLSLASEPRSEVVAMTASLAWAVAAASESAASARKCRVVFMVVFRRGLSGLKFVGGVRPELEFELQPDGMFVAKRFAVVVVILQPQLGALAWIPGQA